MIFNERLKTLRLEHAFTQAAAARAIQIPPRSYQRLELDGSKTHYDTLLKIADCYGVSVDWLMGRTDEREVNSGAPARPEHRIILETEVEAPDTVEPLMRRVIAAALAAEGVELPCEINVLLTDDQGIRQVNREMRDIDRATDVLSFPMFDLRPGEHPETGDEDPESGLVPLGDMCISLERARAQAEEFGHSVEREISYLTVHSALHLLGYDHMDEGPMKRQMRLHEEFILDKLGITRETGEEERQ